MFRLQLFRIRAFTAGSLSSLLAGIGRGGLMFMLIIWLQGIWLPLHGYDFTRTPLWAGIYMLPLTAGFLIAGPDIGNPVRPLRLSPLLDRRDGGRCVFLPAAAVHSGQLLVSGVRAQSSCINGLAMGAFAAPNRAGVMNSLPGRAPRSGLGDELDFPELRPGLLDRDLLHADDRRASQAPSGGAVPRPRRKRRPGTDAARVSHLPPVSILFAAFLGYNPMQHLLGSSVLSHLPASSAATITGRSFFPSLISTPFRDGLHEALLFAAIACLVAAGASALRGGKYVYSETRRGTA